MKQFYFTALLFFFCISHAFSQQSIQGQVLHRDTKRPLPGASIRLQSAKTGTTSDAKGQFSLTAIKTNDTLLISYIGYQTLKVSILQFQKDNNLVLLSPDDQSLQEVLIHTGYASLPKERATGSFTQIDQTLLGRSTEGNIINRLEGLTNGLSFDRRTLNAETNNKPALRVRGVNTIFASSEPLIVVDQFPYEGDINNINPNDVASITVLKDAAAASIWGARAGNGVIVITTKQGRFNQPLKLNLTSNFTIGEKPDLFGSERFLPAADFIEVERMLFDKKYYAEDEKAILSPVVELLIKGRDNLISKTEMERQIDQLKQLDVRDQVGKYLYQNTASQQYALNLSGGTTAARYYFSAGYDNNLDAIKGNSSDRFTLNSTNTFKVGKALEFSAGLYFTQTGSAANGIGLSTLVPTGKIAIYPYAQLADEQGNALPLVSRLRTAYELKAGSLGLLDWQFRPLDDIHLRDITGRDNESRLSSGLKFNFLPGMNLELRHQYQVVNGSDRQFHSMDTYYTRNLINQFTQANGSKLIPDGAILQESQSMRAAHSARAQFNFTHTYGQDHDIHFLAGAEIRHSKYTTPAGSLLYGYDADVAEGRSVFNYDTQNPIRPFGTLRIPAPPTSGNELIDNFISYFANGSYSYLNRYTFSFSTRWDASNLFGVKTNQKGVPLWSIGGSWQINEALKLRSTYGYNGNINKSLTAYPTATYASNPTTNLLYAQLRSAGNPQLRWEKIGTLNLGLDFNLIRNRIAGSMEYYLKNSKDLIGEDFLDPTSGILSGGTGDIKNKINYANMRTQGVDLLLNTQNMLRPFGWQSMVLLNYTRNEVTKYAEGSAFTLDGYIYSSQPVLGRSIDNLYSLPWYGLNGQTGQVQVPVNDALGNNYTSYLSALIADGLHIAGSAVPLWSGSVMNTFTYHGLSLSFNVAWKAAYYYRKESIAYASLFQNWRGHADFSKRWKQAGDELHTTVPAMPAAINANAEKIYASSKVLIEKGDHIRLQDVNLSYSLSKSAWKALPMQNLRLMMSARNLGTLWTAGKGNFDPDYYKATYQPVKTISLSLQASF